MSNTFRDIKEQQQKAFMESPLGKLVIKALSEEAYDFEDDYDDSLDDASLDCSDAQDEQIYIEHEEDDESTLDIESLEGYPSQYLFDSNCVECGDEELDKTLDVETLDGRELSDLSDYEDHVIDKFNDNSEELVTYTENKEESTIILSDDDLKNESFLIENQENSLKTKENKHTYDSVQKNENKENELRELSEEEKQMLKDKLGWSDKQISKCTIDKNGVIHYKTDREDMEGQSTEKGVFYKRKQVVINGITIEGVFPEFNSIYTVDLPEDKYKNKNYSEICNKSLKDAIEKDPELRKKFTDEQLQDIRDGRTPRGYSWHHNETPGKMELVKTDEHDRTKKGGAAHTGGSVLWGPDSQNKKGESF